SSTTTRTVSLPASAALAVFTRNCGTTEPMASNEDPCNPRTRNLRRLNMAILSIKDNVGFVPVQSRVAARRLLNSGKLIVRHGHQRMNRFPNPPVPRRTFRFSFSDKGNQFSPSLRADVPLENRFDQPVNNTCRFGYFFLADQIGSIAGGNRFRAVRIFWC